MNSILWNGKMRVENQTKTRVWEDSILCPETATKNAVQGFHLWSSTIFPNKVSINGIKSIFNIDGEHQAFCNEKLLKLTILREDGQKSVFY
jgi:hypothetical protein